VGVLGYLAFLFLYASDADKQYLSHGFAGPYAPVVGFVTGKTFIIVKYFEAQIVFGTLVALPLFIVWLTPVTKTRTQ
jgi:hypothetical protein